MELKAQPNGAKSSTRERQDNLGVPRAQPKGTGSTTRGHQKCNPGVVGAQPVGAVSLPGGTGRSS